MPEVQPFAIFTVAPRQLIPINVPLDTIVNLSCSVLIVEQESEEGVDPFEVFSHILVENPLEKGLYLFPLN